MPPAAPPPPPPPPRLSASLPPPTVPSRSDIHIPPPPTPLSLLEDQSVPPRCDGRRQIYEEPSAPMPTSPSSIIATRQDPPNASSSASEDFRPSSSGEANQKASSGAKPRSCGSRIRFMSGHTVAEVGSSAWFDPRVLLVFRLALSAWLVSHLVFFSLRHDFSYRLYATWAFAGLTTASLLVLVCSLLQVLRLEDEDEEGTLPPRDEEEGGSRSEDNDAESQNDVSDSGFSYFLAQVAVPMYQTFVTAAIFGAVLYWAAIRPSQPSSISYPLISLHALAPGLAVIDMLFSMSIRFRLVYVPLFVLYNLAYAGALWVFLRLDDLYVYVFLDPSIQPRSQYIAKCGGLAAAVVVAALFLYTVSIMRDICLARKRKEKKLKPKTTKLSEEMMDDTTRSDDHTDSTESVRRTAAGKSAINTSGEFSGKRRDIGGKERVLLPVSALQKASQTRRSSEERADRSGVPLSGGAPASMSKSNSRRFYRSSGPPGMDRSRSVSSVESGERMVRSDSIRSNWEELCMDTMQVVPEDEYFKLPGVYTGGEPEIVKLAPVSVVRSSSGRMNANFLSRSTSGGLSRASSTSSAFRRDRSGTGIPKGETTASGRPQEDLQSSNS